MRNSRALVVGLVVVANAASAQGFALERTALTPAGSGWLFNDALELEGGLGGAVGVSVGYAHRPLSIIDSASGSSIGVVTHQTLASLSAVLWSQRFRFGIDFVSPIFVSGQSGTADGVDYLGPHSNLEKDPDTIGDIRLELDGRIWGELHAPFRIGVGLQLFVPSGGSADYLSDETYRGAVRVLFAGDVQWFSYAANLGVHVRPLDASPLPGYPRGSEALFGLALGATLPTWSPQVALHLGPELSGVTALKTPFAAQAVGLEALLGARLDLFDGGEVRWRFKLAGGTGLISSFGVPEYRLVAGVELCGHVSPPKAP